MNVFKPGKPRLQGLEEARPGELFERRRDEDRDVFERRTWGALNPPKPLFAAQGGVPRKRTGEPLSRSTVLFVLAAAVCAGLAAALV